MGKTFKPSRWRCSETTTGKGELFSAAGELHPLGNVGHCLLSSAWHGEDSHHCGPRDQGEVHPKQAYVCRQTLDHMLFLHSKQGAARTPGGSQKNHNALKRSSQVLHSFLAQAPRQRATLGKAKAIFCPTPATDSPARHSQLEWAPEPLTAVCIPNQNIKRNICVFRSLHCQHFGVHL